MAMHLVVISFYSKAHDLPDLCNIFAARWLVGNWRRLAYSAPNTWIPINDTMLRGLYQQLRKVCWSKSEAELFQVAFTLAFYGAFRISKLFVASTGNCSRQGMVPEDVSTQGSEL